MDIIMCLIKFFFELFKYIYRLRFVLNKFNFPLFRFLDFADIPVIQLMPSEYRTFPKQLLLFSFSFFLLPHRYIRF